MAAMDDYSLQSTSAPESGLKTVFEQLWQQLDERERRAVNSDPVHVKVCLDCNDELVDIQSVDVVTVGHSALGAELIEFACPRCSERHKWFRFR